MYNNTDCSKCSVINEHISSVFSDSSVISDSSDASFQ